MYIYFVIVELSKLGDKNNLHEKYGQNRYFWLFLLKSHAALSTSVIEHKHLRNKCQKCNKEQEESFFLQGLLRCIFKVLNF